MLEVDYICHIFNYMIKMQAQTESESLQALRHSGHEFAIGTITVDRRFPLKIL